VCYRDFKKKRILTNEVRRSKIMCRSLIVLALVLGLVSASFAACFDEIELPDGWVVNAWGGDSTLVGNVLTVNLNGNDSYGKTWHWDMIYQSWNDSAPITAQEVWDRVFDGGSIQYDITYDLSGVTWDDCQVTSPNPENVIGIDTHIAMQLANSDWSLTSWDQSDNLGVVIKSGTVHVVKDLSATATWLSDNFSGPGDISAIQIPFGIQAAPGYTGVLVCTIENMRIVPEPATMTLLGLGSLALIRRKR
jgi:hypothetical protein